LELATLEAPTIELLDPGEEDGSSQSSAS